MRSGDSALSFAEIKTVLQAIPAAMLAVWNAHVRAYLSQHHGDLLAALKSVIEEAALEAVPSD